MNPLSALGCESKTTTYGFPGIRWRSQDDDAVPGIDYAVVLTSLVNDHLMFVVWTDVDLGKDGLGRGASRTGPDSDGWFKYSMSIRHDDLFVPFLWRTKDDKTGSVTIGGERFEMADGTWFLLSTQADPLAVKQLKRNTSKRQLTVDEFREMARTDEEIAEFFRKATEQE